MTYSDKRSRVVGCALLIAIGVGGLAIAFAWLTSGPYTSTFPRVFSSQAWRDADPKAYPSNNERCGMIADLKYRVGVVGKTRSELTDLLGKPEMDAADPSASYWLLCPSFIDIWVLRVRWESNRAVEAIVHDT